MLISQTKLGSELLPERPISLSRPTLQALFPLSSSNDHKDHAARAQSRYSDVISSCVLAGGKGWTRRRCVVVELAALTAALITMSRYAGP